MGARPSALRRLPGSADPALLYCNPATNVTRAPRMHSASGARGRGRLMNRVPPAPEPPWALAAPRGARAESMPRNPARPPPRRLGGAHARQPRSPSTSAPGRHPEGSAAPLCPTAPDRARPKDPGPHHRVHRWPARRTPDSPPRPRTGCTPRSGRSRPTDGAGFSRRRQRMGTRTDRAANKLLRSNRLGAKRPVILSAALHRCFRAPNRGAESKDLLAPEPTWRQASPFSQA